MSRHSSQKALWSEFDPSRQIWIVSDSKTKFFLNRSLLERSEVINEPVKRAKEFWKDLLKQTAPEIRVLEDLGAKISARSFLHSHGQSEWCKRPHAPERLIEACRTLGSLASHDWVEEKLDEFGAFFGESPIFTELCTLARGFYLKSIEAHQLPYFFVPFHIAQNPDGIKLDKEVFFDLGFDMRDGEREAIHALSRMQNVTVIIPGATSEDLVSRGLYVYRNFDSNVAQVTHDHLPVPEIASPAVKLWRCSSYQAEARQAVEQVRKWVAAGVSPENICVTAPQISEYEDILSRDLLWEGIGFQRTLKAPLSASRLFRALGARLKIMNGEMTGRLLEEAFLTVSTYRQDMRRRKERRTLNPIIEISQVPQDELRKSLETLRKKKARGPISVTQFERTLIEIFDNLLEIVETKESYTSSFLKALQKLRGELGERQLEFNFWVEAWQEVTTQIGLTLTPAVEGGVWGVDLNSCEENPAEYLIILGLVEEPTRPSVTSGLGSAKLKFWADNGFDLVPRIKNKNDLQTEWLISGQRSEIFLSTSKTDSGGRALSASSLWIRKATELGRDLEKLDSAHDTQWIHVQKNILVPGVSKQVDLFKGLPENTIAEKGQRLTEEISGLRVIDLSLQVATPLPMTLSASRIESYWECPFKFFARSYLGLYDETDLEIEPSPQVRGLWLHEAAEKILSRGKDLSLWTDTELLALIDSLDDVQKKVSSDVWPNIRSRFLRQLKRFIGFENQWQKDFSKCQPQEFEARILGSLTWSTEDKGFSFVPEADGAPGPEKFWATFKGSVDRIDQTTDGRNIILDYKSSARKVLPISSWSKSGTLQLALYSLAAESGLIDGRPRDVIAAQYYSLQRLEREKGFKLIDSDLMGILPGTASRSAIDKPTREKYFSEIKVQVWNLLEKIREGQMTPKPQNEKLCEKCDWRNSCRAPHLA